ncbi:hypothetical protein BSKO_03024 [Bryopsis sp. KO-2023]|nr:hypothetical protein BSKO_03024 [Bryopsis sp. KO-2023]
MAVRIGGFRPSCGLPSTCPKAQVRSLRPGLLHPRPLVGVRSNGAIAGSRAARTQVRCLNSTPEDVQGALNVLSPGVEGKAIDPKWADWLYYMRDAYEDGLFESAMKRELEQAVRVQDFETASRIRNELSAVGSDDTLSSLNQDLAAAINQERYADAARLRDEGHSALEGWWVARGLDDPCGQMVHIRSDYSRYVARVYSTKDIAEAHGWTDDDEMTSRGRTPSENLREMGRTAMEVYLRANAEGTLEHQACALKIRAATENPDGSLNLPEIGRQVMVASEKDANGNVTKMTVTFKSPDDKEGAMDEEDVEVRYEEGPASLPTQPFSSSNFDDFDEDSEASYWEIEESSDDEGEEEEIGDITPDEALYRVQADLKWLDRDHFYLNVHEDPGPQSVVPEPWGRSITSDLSEAGPSDSDLPLNIIGNLEERAAMSQTGASSVEALQAVARTVGSKQLGGKAEKVTIDRQELVDLLVGMMHGEYTEDTYSKIAELLALNMRQDFGFENEVRFTRIPIDHPPTDPFSGLYLGAFGPHGPELLLVRRTRCGEDVDMVEGLKLTGDPNVPAGEVSFRVNVGRKHRLDSREKYPEELGIIARFPGEGRVADVGFSDPRWVNGEFLQFSRTGGSMLTGGAELGFVWAVPGARRFLILLQRLNLTS